MAELFPHGYGMLAISGLREGKVRAIAEQATEEGYPAWLANVDSFGQMVITGTTAALDRCRELARAMQEPAIRRGRPQAFTVGSPR